MNSREGGAGKTNGDSPVPPLTLETTISDKINSLLNEFIKKDTTNSGKVCIYIYNDKNIYLFVCY